MRNLKRIGAFAVVVLLLALSLCFFSGCEAKKLEPITSIDQLDGKTIGILSSASLWHLEDTFEGCRLVEYESYAELIAALKAGRVDTYIAEIPLVGFQLAEVEGLRPLESEWLSDEIYGFMLNKENAALCAEINGALAALRAEGVLDELEKKWITENESPDFDSAQNWDKTNGTLTVAVTPDSPPFVYKTEDGTVGYEIELIYRIAERLGYGVALMPCEFDAFVSNLDTGKAQLAAAGISYTEERAESVLFTDATYSSGTVAIITDGTTTSVGFFEKMAESFEKTFIRENRWRLLLDGLLVTMEISLFTLILGTLAGFGFSFALRSKNKTVKRIAGALSSLVDGMPILIILMVFYYLLFAKTSLSAIVIGILGLSVEFANIVASLLNTAIEGVDKGEIEAADAMGYSKQKAFFKIIFPQAAARAYTPYIGAVVSMIKGTSIIGYIAAVDLTKAGDIILSRTYEAFFPLIVIALIYFALTQLVAMLFKVAAQKIDPCRKKREVKGVKLHD